MIIIKKVYRFFIKALNIINMKSHHVHYAGAFRINGIPMFTGKGYIEFGENISINSGKRYNPIGGDTQCVFSVINGKISIGNHCGISNSTFVSRSSIIVEDNVLIGGGCKIYDNDFHPLDYEDRIRDDKQKIVSKPVHIESGVFIGAHSIILKGVTIGEKSIIGAGSVVTKSVPSGEIWAGNPAHFIRKLDDC